MVLSFSLALQKAAAEVTKHLAPSVPVSSKPVSYKVLALAFAFVADLFFPSPLCSPTLFDPRTPPPPPLPELPPTPSSPHHSTPQLHPRTSAKETSTKPFDLFTAANGERGNETRRGNRRRDLSARSSSTDRVGTAFEGLLGPGGGTLLDRGKGWEDCSTGASNDATRTFSFLDSFARFYRPFDTLIVCILRNDILYL